MKRPGLFLTIADVLGLSVVDALDHFADQPSVAAALRPINDVGLGYVRLGEPTPSLSGGESQRLRIGWENATDPGTVGAKVFQLVTRRPAPDSWARPASNVVHWLTGAA